jgi:hypothetical protein
MIAVIDFFMDLLKHSIYDFLDKGLLLTRKLLNQGFLVTSKV